MVSLRHFFMFVYLGLNWGMVPILYRLLADARMPVSHVVFLSGIGVGGALYLYSCWRTCSWTVAQPVLLFSAACALFANLPFALNLTTAGHVPPAMMAMIVSTSPLVNYALAWATGWEQSSPRRLAALLLGFVSTLLLIAPGPNSLRAEPLWIAAACVLPVCYCLYNNFAARRWPGTADATQVAAIESGLGGLLGLPFMLAFAPLAASAGPTLSAYGLIAAAVASWVIERVAYFTLIKEKGAVYTGQAIYLATPATVIMSSAIFGGGTDLKLWLSLGLLMFALWLNNTAKPAAKPPSF